MINGKTWAIILAGGEGSRLRALTAQPDGSWIPKQFCSLLDGPTLLHDAVARAHSFLAPERICVVVTERHRRWWQHGLPQKLRPENIFIQPDNKGTAHGILLPLLSIVERDAGANIVMLPADHHVADESVLAAAMQRALMGADAQRHTVTLLGMTPSIADPHLGYVVPGAADAYGAETVSRFVEKPSAAAAQSLIDGGALWNAFILIAASTALLGLFGNEFDATISRLLFVLEVRTRDPGDRRGATIYEELGHVDFSSHVLQRNDPVLRVYRVPECGWSDLGTPERVTAAVQRVAPAHRPRSTRSLLRGLLNAS